MMFKPGAGVSSFTPGAFNPGIGTPWKSLRQGFASQRAQRLALFRRALSVAIPVLAYICR